jgi:hypothetical protein
VQDKLKPIFYQPLVFHDPLSEVESGYSHHQAVSVALNACQEVEMYPFGAVHFTIFSEGVTIL